MGEGSMFEEPDFSRGQSAGDGEDDVDNELDEEDLADDDDEEDLADDDEGGAHGAPFGYIRI